MIPKKMFRAYDADKRRGNLFVLAFKDGPGGKVFWRPDSEAVEAITVEVDDLDKWEDIGIVKTLTLYNEIPIEEGTESLSIVQVSMDAAPTMKAKPSE